MKNCSQTRKHLRVFVFFSVCHERPGLEPRSNALHGLLQVFTDVTRYKERAQFLTLASVFVECSAREQRQVSEGDQSWRLVRFLRQKSKLLPKIPSKAVTILRST